MTEQNKPLSDGELDGLFVAAARRNVEPSADLLGRIVADADAVRDAADLALAPLSAPAPVPGRGVFASLLAAIGGWPAVGGLITATVAGVWIGYVSPDTVDGLAEDFLTSQSAYEVGDFMPVFDDLFYEG